MFDIGWQEIFVVAVLAVLVVGPKELPRVLRTVMGLVRKARMVARDFQNGLDEVIREADLDDIKKQIGDMADGDITKTIENTLDPDGEIAKGLDMTEIQNDIGKLAMDGADLEQTTDTEGTDFDAVTPPIIDAVAVDVPEDAPGDAPEERSDAPKEKTAASEEKKTAASEEKKDG